jgi:hypothetical protein
LPHVRARIARIKHELVNGRGVVRLRGVDRARYDNDEMCLIYWGIGAHLGSPWAQNAAGHVLGDVTDQGKAPDDPTSRGNEIGGVKLPFHCDGSDLETDAYETRPPCFVNNVSSSWNEKRVISRLDAVRAN